MADSILGNTLGQLRQTVKQAAKQVVKIPEEMAADLGGQVGSAPQRLDSEGQAKPAASAKSDLASGEPRWQSDEERVKFLRGLYGSDQTKPDVKQTSVNPLVSSGQEKPSEFKEQIKNETPEEQKKLIELRNQLHKENYYDPTFNRPNPSAGGEERPAEKVEQEKKQEMQELEQKEAKKPPPLAVVREQNKAEMFRGAAG